MPYLREPYQQQKRNAKRRGIPFLLTFNEWIAIWETSGKLDYRGRKSGQYVMARPGDTGAYEQGNVKIITHIENTSEWPRTEAYRRKISALLSGRPRTEETRQKSSASVTGEKNSQAKLTEGEVVKIFLAGGTHESIAARFGVSGAHVSRIKNGKTWVNVTRRSG